MKPIGTAIVLLGWLSSTAAAAEPKVSSEDLDHARLYLRQTQGLAVGATKGLSKAQWNFKPAPDRWSIAEILEHMVLAQEHILGPVREQLAKAPATSKRGNKQLDEFLITQVPDRTAKFQAPDFLTPTGRWTPDESMRRLLKNYGELNTYLGTTTDLRNHEVEAPALKVISKGLYGAIDGYQAILLVAAHTERHTKQMLEVRADAGFPSK